ncbi:hypothetical protein PTKIN_Ptkin03bG0127700 [Pterospermum kingtungense]
MNGVVDSETVVGVTSSDSKEYLSVKRSDFPSDFVFGASTAAAEGHIWIESEGLGKGCTTIFIVKLGIPERFNESKLSLMPKVPTNHGPTAFSWLKVLVMDENGLRHRLLQNLKIHFCWLSGDEIL